MQGACEREAIVPTHDFAPGLSRPKRRTSRSVMRAALEASIQAAIDFLDTLDGDADLEEGGDIEPGLGSGELVNVTLCRLASTISGDVVRLVDLGGLDQTAWAEGDCTDREDGDDTGIADSGGVAEQSGSVRRCASDEVAASRV